MADSFSRSEWRRIRRLLRRDRDRSGLPKRVYGFVPAGSFNIRTLGAPDSRDEETWEFLADVCRRFDLPAVEEMMPNLRGISKLEGMMAPDEQNLG